MIAQASRFSLLLAAALVVSGCAQDKFPITRPVTPGNTEVPGSDIWDQSDEVQCTATADCGPLETCIDGVCRLNGCTNADAPTPPPLGERHYLSVKRDLVVAGDSSMTGYIPNSTYDFVQPATVSSWNATSPTDVAGGNFFNSRPEAFANIRAGQKNVIFTRGYSSTLVTLPLSFQPTSIAGGDTNGDGLDELVAFGAAGEIALCDPRAKTCKAPTFAHAWKGLDTSVADVDGDGYGEALFLGEEAGKLTLFIWNVNGNITGEVELRKAPFTETGLVRLTSGDLDGDKIAEILALKDNGWMGIPTDDLNVYTLDNAGVTLQGTTKVEGRAADIAAGDVDGNQLAEVAVLAKGTQLDLFKGSTLIKGALATVKRSTLKNYGSRISLFDLNGDSPAGRLIDGPKLLPGQVIPIAVLAFPPFSRTYSEGIASVSLGAGTSTSNSISSSVSYGIGGSVGFSVGLDAFFGKIGSSTSISLSRDISRSQSFSKGVSISNSFSFGSRVERYGSEYAGVVVACGCFAAYTYEVEDPSGVSGGNREKFVVASPVGGQTTLWSSRRYNAIAAQLGYLPQVTVGHQIGDPTSYPNTYVTLEGGALNQADLVFPTPPFFRTSDIGQVGWGLSADESETNGTNTSYNLGFSTTISLQIMKMVGASGTLNLSRGWSNGSSVSLGKSISFGGNVPGIPDNPATPEDEYLVHGFAFSPYVYKQSYKDAAGSSAGYYVLNYTVRK